MVHLLGSLLRRRLVYLSLWEAQVGCHFHLNCCCCLEGHLHCSGHLDHHLHLVDRQVFLDRCRVLSHVDYLSLDLC